ASAWGSPFHASYGVIQEAREDLTHASLAFLTQVLQEGAPHPPFTLQNMPSGPCPMRPPAHNLSWLQNIQPPKYQYLQAMPREHLCMLILCTINFLDPMSCPDSRFYHLWIVRNLADQPVFYSGSTAHWGYLLVAPPQGYEHGHVTWRSP
ncbi:hypothetical protein G0U57_021848, partial [Chelydra serpentina]